MYCPPRIVHEPVDPAMLRKDLRHHSRYRLLVANVADVNGGSSPIFGDFRRDCLQLVRRASDKRNGSAERREFMRHATAEPAAATCHDDRFADEKIVSKNRGVGHCVFPECQEASWRPMISFMISFVPP